MTQRSTLNFLRTEAAGGVVLVVAAVLAIVAANTPWADEYAAFIHLPLTVQFGAFEETLSVLDWVNQGLMAVFFFVVGMEIKFEVLKGELANPRRLALPIMAALGGMIASVLSYLAIAGQVPDAPRGWAAAAPTDIAVAIAALAAVSRGLPGSLRLFLLTLAIADDLFAVILTGVLFPGAFGAGELILALLSLAGMALLGRWRSPFLFYAIGFLFVWGFTLKAGINTSVAGVAAAMTVPSSPRRPGQESVLKYFLDSLHPYVAFAILPMFAFCAAGFNFRDLAAERFLNPVTLGLAAGLFLGKQMGVMGGAALAIGLKLGRKPTAATWLELWGAAILCGAGFTLSLYIGALAFPEQGALQGQMRLGVITGSLLSTAVGMAVLAYCGRLRARRGQMDSPTF